MASRLIRVGYISVFATSLLFSSACDETATPLSGTPPPSSQVTVNLQASAFAPASVSVSRGGTVTWLNAAPIAHNITPNNPSQAGTWVAQNVPAQQGFSFAHTFNTAGTFNYACTLHTGMTGTVSVE